jgi:hypothetical protein
MSTLAAFPTSFHLITVLRKMLIILSTRCACQSAAGICHVTFMGTYQAPDGIAWIHRFGTLGQIEISQLKLQLIRVEI